MSSASPTPSRSPTAKLIKPEKKEQTRNKRKEVKREGKAGKQPAKTPSPLPRAHPYAAVEITRDDSPGRTAHSAASLRA